MSLRYAILGLLTNEDATGYELTKRFEITTIHFWHAHHTQIYRELSKLEKEGLVESKIIQQDDFPDKKVYKLKEEGYEDLLTWLINSDVDKPKLKDGQLLKISLFHLISSDHAIIFLQKRKEEHQRILEAMKECRTDDFPGKDVKKAKIGEYLTLEYGIRHMENVIGWCDWAIKVLEGLEE